MYRKYDNIDGIKLQKICPLGFIIIISSVMRRNSQRLLEKRNRWISMRCLRGLVQYVGT